MKAVNEDLKTKTESALRNPKAGMRFHEMYSHWIYVMAVSPGGIVTREFSGHPKNPPCDQIKFVTYRTAKEFYQHTQYCLYCDNEAFTATERETVVTAKELGYS